MKRSAVIAVTLVAAATVLAGCDSARKALTQTKAAPDEFSVYTRAPLTLPPDYGLRPPSDDSRSEVASESTQTQAKRVLLGSRGEDQQPIEAATPGTSALLARAGVQNADPNIREVVDRETTAYAKEDLRFLEKLMFDEANVGTVVDPAAEARRIQENQALGRPINEGETTMIETKPTSGIGNIFDGLFN